MIPQKKDRQKEEEEERGVTEQEVEIVMEIEARGEIVGNTAALTNTI